MILLPLPRRFVEIATPAPLLDAAAARAVGEIWQEELKRRPSLFNGSVFSVEKVTEDEISGRFVEYRRFLAQWKRPELFAALRIEMLAVTGVLTVQNGIVWGRRGTQSTQHPGTWELIPAGGVDETARTADGDLDPLRALLQELKEEVGLGEKAVRRIRPICLVHDARHHFYEYGIELQVTSSMNEIFESRSNLQHPEHSEIALIEPGGIEKMIAGQPQPLSDLTRLILSARK